MGKSTHLVLDQPGLTILIISPQAWDGFQVSKHHYAIELSKIGHQVIFVNPPQLEKKRGYLSITRSKKYKNIRILNYTPWFPYRIKFHMRWLFNWAMKKQAKIIIKACKEKPDIVWDFDNTYNFKSLKPFSTALSVFHVVDKVVAGFSSTKGADIVIAISESIVKDINTENTPYHVVGHGLSETYEKFAIQRLKKNDSANLHKPVQVGYVGNLLAMAVDGKVINKIVNGNPDINFLFFGPYQDKANNLISPDWVENLRKLKNTTFYGLCTQDEILNKTSNIDVWLVCYDNYLELNSGTDSHKILEYLSTGLPIVSSHLDAYEGSNLLSMPKTKSNDDLPDIFNNLIQNMDNTAIENSERRIIFAMNKTYAKRLNEIFSILRENKLII